MRRTRLIGLLAATLACGLWGASLAPAKSPPPPPANHHAPVQWGRTPGPPAAPPVVPAAQPQAKALPPLAAPPPSQAKAPVSDGVQKPSSTAQPQNQALPGQPKQAAVPPAQAPTATSDGLKKPSSSALPPTTATAPNVQRTELNRAVAVQQSADVVKQIRQEQQAKFQTPPPKVEVTPANTQIVRRIVVGPPPPPQVIYERRTVVYRDLGYSRPIWVGLGAPRYGIWDTDYLEYSYRHDPLFFYHHSSDPGVMAWRRERERLALQNAELRALMAEQDAIIARQSGPRNESYISAKVDPQVVLATEVVADESATELRFAAGQSTYYALCAGRTMPDGSKDLTGFRAMTEDVLDVECIRTAGSTANARLFLAGKADAAIVQSDDIAAIKEKFGKNQFTAYNEVMMVLVRKGSIRSVAELKPGHHVVHVGPSGSGTENSFFTFQKNASKSAWWGLSTARNAQYEGVVTKNTDDYLDAVKAVAADERNVMLVLTPAYSPFMQMVERDYGDQVELLPVSGDASFIGIKDADGNYPYRKCVMSGASYPKLLKKAESAETLCVQAVVVVSDAWVKKNAKPRNALIAAEKFDNQWRSMGPELMRVNGGVQ